MVTRFLLREPSFPPHKLQFSIFVPMPFLKQLKQTSFTAPSITTRFVVIEYSFPPHTSHFPMSSATLAFFPRITYEFYEFKLHTHQQLPHLFNHLILEHPSKFRKFYAVYYYKQKLANFESFISVKVIDVTGSSSR